MQLASDDIEARFVPVKCESGTRTPSTRSQNNTSSTSAKESMPACDSGLCSSNSTPSATKLVRANSQSCAAIFLGSCSGVITKSGWRQVNQASWQKHNSRSKHETNIYSAAAIGSRG